MKINQESFQRYIWNFYHTHKRGFLWRETNDPYNIVVSEIMLQQTQTTRVATVYPHFLNRFPCFQTLAQAPLSQLLIAWQGLGYNRRARYLQEIAKRVMTEYHGVLPDSAAILETFPGIGKNTAGSIAAFAFQKPTVFIETNIRTVFLYHFFYEVDNVPDHDILALVAQTTCQKNPRHWYYALMDYGAFLKKQIVNPNRRSKHYSKQSRFQGSDRQIRGQILKLLMHREKLTTQQLCDRLAVEAVRMNHILQQLCKDQLISCYKGFLYSINNRL